MSSLRYFAIGHSYLLHGPFNGWQTTGAWGMAATEEKNDYFHKFISMLEDGGKEVKAIARNYATYERICVKDATADDYRSSSEYAEMKDTIRRFKPNIISIGIGGGNTVANDEESLTLFFDTLFEMVTEVKLPDTAVLCLGFHKNVARPLTRMAEKYGFIPISFEYLHDKEGYDNPYYAFSDYPDYDAVAARGGIEFRTHPGNLGHEAIAKGMYAEIRRLTEQGFGPDDVCDYEYESLKAANRFSSFEIVTQPKMSLKYNGFNIRQSGTCIIFGSAPETGASVSCDDLDIGGAHMFSTEIAADGADILNLYVITDNGDYSFQAPVTGGELLKHEIDLTGLTGRIRSFVLKPNSTECVIKIKNIKIV